MKTAFAVMMCVWLAACAAPEHKAPLPPQEAAPPVNLEVEVSALEQAQAAKAAAAEAEAEEAPPTNESQRPAPSFTMATPTARKTLLGKWYGIAKGADGGSKEWLIERLNDGTYRIDFRFTSASGIITSQSEVGFWGVSQDIYFRIFRGWVQPNGMKAGDPTDPDHYDAYEILALSSRYFRYRHLGLKEIYTVKKMPAHFNLPVVANSQISEPLKFEY